MALVLLSPVCMLPPHRQEILEARYLQCVLVLTEFCKELAAIMQVKTCDPTM